MLGFVLMIIAVILFILAAIPTISTKANLIALGLAFMAGSFLLGLYPG